MNSDPCQKLLDENARLKTEHVKILAYQDKLKHFLSAGPAVIYACRAYGDFGTTFISDNVVSQMGYNPDQFIENSSFWADHIHPDDAKRVLSEISNLFDKGEYVHEYRFLKDDGTYRWVRDELKLLSDSDGKPVEIIGYWTDTTEVVERRKGAETLKKQLERQAAELAIANRALEKSQKEMEIIIDSIQGLVFYKDVENRFLRVNKYVADAYHLTKDEMTNKSLFDLHPRDEAQSYFDDDLVVIKSGKPRLNIVEKWVTKEGIKWVRTDKIPYVDVHGQVKGVIGVSMDITELKKAEVTIQKANAYNRSLLETNIDPFVTISIDGKITDVNQATEKATGFPREALIGTDFASYFTESKIARNVYEQTSRDGIVRNYALELRHRDGHAIPVLYNASVYKDSETGKVLGIFASARDITELNRQRQFLRQVIDSVPAFICVKAGSGVYELANRSLARAYGTDVAGLEGKTDLEFSPTPEEAEAFQKDDIEVIRGKKIKAIPEERITHADGSVHWLTTTKIPLVEPDGSCTRLLAVAMDITELREHREHLQELVNQRTIDLKLSQDRLLEAQRVAHLGNWDWDPVKDKITGSEEFYRLFDLPSEQLAKFAQFTARLHPDDVDRVQQDVAEALKKKKPYNTDYRIKLRDNEWRDINARGEAFLDEKGNPIRMVGTCLDITERQKIGKQLKQSEEKYRNLFENAQAGMYRTKLDGSAILSINPALAEMTGRSVEEMLSGSSLMHWAEQEQRKLYAEILARDKHITNFEAKIIKKGGEIRILLLSAKLYPEFGIIEGSATDITALRLAEEELQLKDFVFKASLTADSIASNDGLLTHANQSFVQVWGYDSIEEVIGKPISDFIAEQEKIPEILDALTSKGAWEGEYLARKKDGSTFVAQSKANVVRDPNGKQIALYSSVVDITEKKRNEEALRRALDELSRSNRDLEQFAYVSSHDLQEPLRMVSSYVKLLERRYKDKLDSDANEFIEFIVDGASRMQQLINDLLTFSRVNTRGKEFEMTRFEDAFDTSIENLRMAIDDVGGTVTHDPLPTILADKGQIVQLLQNLIGNAIKFHGDEKPRVHVSAKKDAGNWIFSVKDNGIGIDPQYFDRLFIIFQRLHARTDYPGTGIGLSICKRIVERHGGKIWIESTPGKGSTFLFSIPSKVSR